MKPTSGVLTKTSLTVTHRRLGTPRAVRSARGIASVSSSLNLSSPKSAFSSRGSPKPEGSRWRHTRAQPHTMVHPNNVQLQGRQLSSSSNLSAAVTATAAVQEELYSESSDLQARTSQQRAKVDGEEGILGPLQQYQSMIEKGILRGDDHQTRIIQKLQDLHDKLAEYVAPEIPSTAENSSLISRLFSREAPLPISPPPSAPKGLYLYGDVGTGKTMLMDLFYQTLPSVHPLTSKPLLKRRVHFHAFMIDVHKRLHGAKIAMGYRGGDPIAPVARDLAREASVLCFDEFQVTDIADAMILRRLLESLVNYGVVCVMTSNRHPDDLYKNGIQRSSFVPAIELLKTQFDVTDLDSGTDYRRIPRALSKVYFSPLTDSNTQEVNKIFNSLASSDPSDPPVRNRKLTIWGRELAVPESTGKTKIAKFDFNELCGKPLSAADYLEVTKAFKTIFVMDVKKMGMGEKDLARRFITFIDACYESKTKLFVTSEVPIHQVFSDDAGGKTKDISDHMRSVMDDLGLSTDIVGNSSMFTGEEEVFAFARACSRLVQMGSKEWAETAGID